MVSWTRSTTPLVCGLPARMNRWRAPTWATARSNSADRNSEALSVMTFSSSQPREARSAATRRASSEVHRALGLRGVRCSSAQQWAEATSIAVYCHTAPLAPGEGRAPLLHERRGLVGHLGPPTLPGPQDLRAEPEHLSPPPVVRGGVDPHGPAGGPGVAELLGQGQCSQPELVQGIINGQGGPPFRSTGRSSERMGRLLLQVWEVDGRRYISGIGHPKRPDPPVPSALDLANSISVRGPSQRARCRPFARARQARPLERVKTVGGQAAAVARVV